MEKTADAFRTISEVASDLDLPQHVLRFWETRFLQVRPLKRAGGRRYYRPGDIAVLRNIRRLLYDEGYTIKGVQRLMKERGVRELRETPPADVDATAGAPAGEIAEADEGLDDASAEGDRVVPNGATATDRSVLRECLAIIEDCERILRTARSA